MTEVEIPCKLCGHSLLHHGPGNIPVQIFCNDCPTGTCKDEIRNPKEDD